eukprot:3970443-Pyramimonas_sp.AAC.2
MSVTTSFRVEAQVKKNPKCPKRKLYLDHDDEASKSLRKKQSRALEGHIEVEGETFARLSTDMRKSKMVQDIREGDFGSNV